MPSSIANRSTPGKLADVDMDAVVERIAAGEYQSTIAKELGVTPSALCLRLRDHPSAAIAREMGIELRLDDGLSRIERAADAGDLNLVRAYDAALRRLEWRASVEVPSRWGQRPQIAVNATGPVQINIIESWSVAPEQHAALLSDDNADIATTQAMDANDIGVDT